MDLELSADISLQLGRAVDAMEAAARNARAAWLAETPHPYRIVATGVVDANGNATLFAQGKSGPDQGHFWQIRSIVVGGQHANDTVTGRADVFATATDVVQSSAPPGGNYLQQMGLTEWRDTTPAIPNIAFYSRGAMTIRCPEQIAIVITAGTAGQIIAANIQVEDFQESTRNMGGF